MTAFNYAKPLATANRLIARYGMAGVLRRAGATTGPVHNPTPGASVDHPVVFVTLGYEGAEIDGTRILATDKKILLAVGSLTITPATSDLLVEATGSPYKVVDVAPLAPGGTTVLYQIQARR